MKGWRGFVGAAMLFTSLVTVRPAAAGFLEDAGWGSATILANVLYMPTKLVYATLGGVTGGLAYALTIGDFETAETVWVTSMGGTYVITPNMLQGEDPIAFSGTPSSETPGEPPTDWSGTQGLDETQLSEQQRELRSR